MPSFTQVGLIAPVPFIANGKTPHHLCSTSDGRRLLYGTQTGVVSRALPDQLEGKTKLLETFTNNACQIQATAVSMDGQLIAGGDNDGQIYLWKKEYDGATLSLLNVGLKHVQIRDISFSDDSRRLVVGGVNHHSIHCGVCINTGDGSIISYLTGHIGGINSVSFRNKRSDVIVTGGVDGNVCFHSGSQFQTVHTGKGHIGEIFCVRFSPDGTHVATCGEDGYIFGWTVGCGEIDKKIKISDRSLLSLAWSQDGNRIAVVSLDKKVRIIDFHSGIILDEIMIGFHSSTTPIGVCWTVTDWICCVSEYGQVWGYKTEQQQHLLYDQQFIWQGLQGAGTTMSIEPITGRMVLADTLGSLLFASTFDLDPKTTNMIRLPSPEKIQSVVMGKEFGVAVTHKGIIRLFRVMKEMMLGGKASFHLAANETPKKLEENTKIIKTSNTLSTFEKSIISYADGYTTLTSGGFAALLPVKENNWVSYHHLQREIITAVALDDARVIGVFSSDGFVHVYPFSGAGADFSLLWSLKLQGRITCATATVDGGLLAVALQSLSDYPAERLKTGRGTRSGGGPLIEFYEIDDATKSDGFEFVCVYDLHTAEITSVALNSSGTYIASADASMNIFVVEIESGRQLIDTQWNLHKDRVTNLVWSPDGLKLASCSLDGSIFIWDIKSPNRYIHIQDVHRAGVTSVMFIFNNVILSTGMDGTIAAFELVYDEITTTEMVGARIAEN